MRKPLGRAPVSRYHTRMSMHRRQLLRLAVAALGAVAGTGAAAPWLRAAPPDEVVVLHTPQGAVPIRVEVVDTPEARARGLMHREHLPADAGMLFAYERSRPVSMWMKNTLIPLDMLFIDERGVVAGVAEDTEPMSLETIRSPRPVLAVLELNAGTARKLGITAGTRVEHPLFAPAAD